MIWCLAMIRQTGVIIHKRNVIIRQWTRLLNMAIGPLIIWTFEIVIPEWILTWNASCSGFGKFLSRGH